MPKARLNRIEHGLAILNRVCLHFLQNRDLYDDEARAIVIDAIVRVVTGTKRPKGFALDHIDGNTSNNTIENLRLVTLKENR